MVANHLRCRLQNIFISLPNTFKLIKSIKITLLDEIIQFLI